MGRTGLWRLAGSALAIILTIGVLASIMTTPASGAAGARTTMQAVTTTVTCTVTATTTVAPTTQTVTTASPTTVTTTVLTTVTTTIPTTLTTTDTTTTTTTTDTTTTDTTTTDTTTTITNGSGSIFAVAAEACPPPPVGNFTTILTSTGLGGVNPGPGSYTSPANSTQVYKATPNAGSVFIGWTIDGIFAGFGPQLDLPVTKNRTVQAAFAPIPQFCDITTSTPNYTAITELAARGVILGSDNPNGSGKCFRPDDVLLRIHVAGMVARLFGWDTENRGNVFTDKGSVDDNLWRNAGTLAYYNVARGYEDNTYRPTDPVLKVQGVSFVTRAMIRKEYWALLEDNAAYYTAVPPASSHRQDLVTFFTNAGNVPGTSAPTEAWGGPNGYSSPASRSYFAQTLWQGYAAYFSINRIP